MVLLDTHIWIWWLGGNDELSKHERDELDYQASKHQIAIAAISLWEAQMGTSKGRIMLNMAFDQWIREAARPDVVHIVPIDINVALALQELPEKFQGDPADRMIIASALSRNYELATHDRELRKSRLVRHWKIKK